MTNQEAIKYLQQLYPNGGHCWLDEQRIEAIGMAVKALQEEPVSEECIEELRTKLDSMSKEDFKKVFDKYAIDFNEEPVSDDLEEEIVRYIGYPQEVDEDVSTTMIRKAARHFANWQKQQDSKLPKIWPRDTIEEYAYQCAYDLSNDWAKGTPEWSDVQNACILGAQWQEEKDMQKFLHSETATFTREEFDAEIEEVRKQAKEQMMKDMPKWKKHIKSLLVEGAEEIPCVLSNRLLAYHGYTIEIAELEKLPKED